MSTFWDPRNKRPQPWTYPVFIILTIIVLLAIYMYGNRKADENPPKPQQEETE